MLWCHSHLLNVWIEDLPGAFLEPVHVHCAETKAVNEILEVKKTKWKRGALDMIEAKQVEHRNQSC